MQGFDLKINEKVSKDGNWTYMKMQGFDPI
jgi:hypothetical protein